MPTSRRSFLGRLAAVITLPALKGVSFAETLPAPDAGSPARSIVLSRNENAYGPSEKVMAVMRDALSGGNRYPRTEYDLLITRIAAFHGVNPERVVLGCGSSEILQVAAAAFLSPGKKLVQASPTFPLLGRYAQSAGAVVVNVPLNKMYQHDLDAMLSRADASTSLVYICNPNNPTGTLTPRKDLDIFIHKLPPGAMVFVDEAYHHFVSGTSAYASFIDHPLDDSRVIVARTFSKIYGLAGMRVGYAIVSPDIARRLSAQRLQFSVGVVSARAAAAALDDAEYVLMAAKRNANDRQEFMNQVNARMLRALDSHTNFVMLNPLRPVDEVAEHLKKHNIIVAPSIPEMNKYIRVSLGTPAEMLEFWRVWDLMPHTMVM